MRLLPRSSCGIWLLSTAVWAGLCASAWSVLPVAPRAEWTLPEPASVVSFGPGGGEVFTLAWNRTATDGRASEGNYCGPLRAWDTATGRQTRAVLSSADRFDVESVGQCSQLSGDGRWLALVSPELTDRRIRLVEVATGRVVQLPAGEAHYYSVRPWRFSADGRWFVYPQQRGGRSGLCVWDLGRAREHAFLSPAYPPFGISPDGGQLVSHVGEHWWSSSGVGVWDVPTAKLTRHLDNPSQYSDFGYFLAYSPEGRVIIEVSNSGGPYESRVVVWRWAADTGKFMSPAPPLNDVFVLPSGHVVGMYADPQGWCQLELSGADVRGRPILPIDRGDIVTSRPWCPNGRVAAVWPAPGTAHKVAEWAFQHHLGWLIRFPGYRIDFYDTNTGRELGTVRLQDGPSFTWAPDGSMIACHLPLGKGVQIWDIPPRKPLAWFTAVAGLLALLVGALAWWRCRRLRRTAVT
jgi:WD40 repeat protein